MDDEQMIMPCFYIRSNSFIALFKIEDKQIVAELVPSANLLKEIKESKWRDLRSVLVLI